MPRIVLWLTVLAFAAPAQQPAAPDATIRVDVRQVLVPVVVTDKKGHTVSGLRAADFQVAEDGVAQDIVAFTREIAASSGGVPAPVAPAAAASGPAVSTVAPQQMWVICFDALHTSFENFGRARAAIEKALDKLPAAGDRFVLLSIGRRLHVLQPATGDVSLIRAKVNSKEFANLPAESESTQLTTAEDNVRKRMDQYCTTCPCGRDTNNRRSTCEEESQQIKQELDARSEQFGMYDNLFFEQLKSVIDELAKIDSRRNLILVSDGFAMQPGRELFATAGAYLPNSPYFKMDPSRNMQPALEQSLKVAAAQNIVVDTVDARGSYTPAARPGGMLDASNSAPGSTGRQEVLGSRRADPLRGGSILDDTDSKWSSVENDKGSALSQLAQASGGLYFHDNNDLQRGFREALDDRRETYVLAYVPKNDVRDGKFRRITVTVGKGSVTVRAKSGYWAENAAAHQ